MERTMPQSESLIKKPFTVDSKVVSELAFLFTIYILVTGLLILHFRAWEPDIVRQVLGIFAYPAAFFGGVALVWPYITNVIWILPIACLILMGLPFLMALLGAWSLLPLGVFGVTATLFAYRACHPKLRAKTLQLVLAGSILAVIYFVVCNSRTTANIFADIAAYTTTILQHQDTFFHSAIVQMLANFNTPSTGLDGLKKISYHIFTHRWVAANLKILGGAAPLLLGICQQVAFLPAVFFVASLIVGLLASIEISALTVCGLNFLALWLLSTPLLIWDPALGMRDQPSYIVSESYAFSWLIFIAMLPVGRAWLFQACQNRRWLSIHPLAMALALAAILVCGAVKISTGVMLALFLILCAFIPKILQKDSISWFNFGRFIVLAVAFALGCLVVASHLGYFNDLVKIAPLDFIRYNFMAFIWINQMFLGLIILLYFLSGKDEKLYQRSQVSMLIVLFLGAQVPGNLMTMGPGMAIYFFEPALLATLFFTLPAVADYWQAHQKMGLFAVKNPVNYSWQPVPRKLLILGLATLTMTIFASEIVYFKSQVVSLSRKSIIALYGASTQEQLSQRPISLNERKHQFIDLLLSSPNQVQKLKQDTELGSIQSHIRELNLSPNYPKSTVIYIAPDFVDFWRPQGIEQNSEMLRSQGPSPDSYLSWRPLPCWNRPFLIPAITGFPLLNGVRDKNNTCQGPGRFYGMGDYNSESWNRPLSALDLCTKATHLGFAQVLSITDRSKYTLLTCPAKTASK